MSDQPEKDPKELHEERADYVEDKSGGGDPEVQPNVGTDPMSLPEEGTHKTIISPDPAKVREAERKGRGY
ncbi:MAG: hypothetical protein ABJF88_01085 [Rhodothermales bacterium]